jgi:hypothetical protein
MLLISSDELTRSEGCLFDKVIRSAGYRQQSKERNDDTTIHQKKEKNSSKVEEKRRINSNDSTISRRAHKGATMISCSKETEEEEIFVPSSICNQWQKIFHRKRLRSQKEDFQIWQFQYSSHQYQLTFT